MRLTMRTAAALGLLGVAGLAFGQQPAEPPAAARVAADAGVAAEVASTNRVVVTAMLPIPDVGPGAPQFTAADVKVLQEEAKDSKVAAKSDLRKCLGSPLANLIAEEEAAAEYVMSTSQGAIRATEKAEAARRNGAVGKASKKDVEDAELQRQNAVEKMEGARLKLMQARADTAEMQDALLSGRLIDKGELFGRSAQRLRQGWGLGLATPAEKPGLTIDSVQAVQRADKKGEVVEVTGLIRNQGDRTFPIPDLSAVLVDEDGWALKSLSVQPDAGASVNAGEARAFRIEMRPAPTATHRAVVTFANEATPPNRLRVDFLCNGGSPAQMRARGQIPR